MGSPPAQRFRDLETSFRQAAGSHPETLDRRVRNLVVELARTYQQASDSLPRFGIEWPESTDQAIADDSQWWATGLIILQTIAIEFREELPLSPLGGRRKVLANDGEMVVTALANISKAVLADNAATISHWLADIIDSKTRNTSDDSLEEAYVNALPLWEGRFAPLPQFKRWLRNHPEIPVIPKGRRLLVHAAKCLKAFDREDKRTSDSLDDAEKFVQHAKSRVQKFQDKKRRRP